VPKASIAFWRNADLRRILTGKLISDFSSEIGELALPIFAATTLNATAAQMAGLLSAEYLPRIVIGLVAAGWIDRLLRRPVLITTNVARCTLFCLVALAAWQQVLSIEHLYILAVLIAGLDVLFSSTFAAYLPTLVPTSCSPRPTAPVQARVPPPVCSAPRSRVH
jgi:MFS family permease